MKIVRGILLAALIVCFVLLAAWTVYAPLFLETLSVLLSVIVALGGLCGLWILVELMLIVRTLYKNDPFTERNVRALKRMGIVSLCTAALSVAAFVVRCVLGHNGALYLGVAIVFLLCGLFALTLGYVFGQAVAFKQENDLTI